MNAAYAALLVEAERVGWPERFQTDLTEHDQRTLAERRPTDPFAWVLSNGATYLVFPSAVPIDGAGTYAHRRPRACAESFGRENCRWYWWDGARLIAEETPEALANRLEETGERMKR
jgi:hypothetical protein